MSISKEKFKEMLREKGLKVTNQRILVLEVLADHRDKHLTAEDIYELVRDHHHHLICRTCGKIIPFKDDLLENLEDKIEETTGFHVGNAIGGSYQS